MTTYEVMDRDGDTFHSEHRSLAEAKKAAKTLTYAEVYRVEGGVTTETVFLHGGKLCKGCGLFDYEAKTERFCDGCEEAERDFEAFYAENRIDMFH